MMVQPKEKKPQPERPESGTCCVCGHELRHHKEESYLHPKLSGPIPIPGWRCHALGPSGFQCECWLRLQKARPNLEYYDVARKSQKFLREHR